MSDIVYLDIGCFKRPFDDAGFERVRRESEAVAAVLEAASSGRIQIVRSPAHDMENETLAKTGGWQLRCGWRRRR